LATISCKRIELLRFLPCLETRDEGKSFSLSRTESEVFFLEELSEEEEEGTKKKKNVKKKDYNSGEILVKKF
jgi:hypothetical protein